eukprot:TRINITY_DN30863_c0_g1_i1.p1 TRINITY_DN30863_c0_g1~~TRINITY_DN30863_c0_g1_i1.p1  ORF type:complete len:292 (+),score=97.58 TRINITY_DN30863_c0_g1_i1:529-1404(+)
MCAMHSTSRRVVVSSKVEALDDVQEKAAPEFIRLRSPWPVWFYKAALFALWAMSWWFGCIETLFLAGWVERRCQLEVSLFVIVAALEGCLLLSRAVLLQRTVRAAKLTALYVVLLALLLIPHVLLIEQDGAQCVDYEPISVALILVHVPGVWYGLKHTRAGFAVSRTIQIVSVAACFNLVATCVSSVLFIFFPTFLRLQAIVASINALLDGVLTSYLIARMVRKAWRRRHSAAQYDVSDTRYNRRRSITTRNPSVTPVHVDRGPCAAASTETPSQPQRSSAQRHNRTEPPT